MVYYALIMPVFLMLISGCVFVGHRTKTNSDKPALLADVYAQSVGDAQKDMAKFIEQNLKEHKIFGYVKPYIPVIQGPVVRKVWLPDHKSQEDASVLVGGHWVYLMIEGPRWFVEEENHDVQVPVIVPGKPKSLPP